MILPDTITQEQAETLHLLQDEAMGKVLDLIRATFIGKNTKYRVSPVLTLPPESWKHQIRIKAERALQATSPEKETDEILDCAVYCIMLLARERVLGDVQQPATTGNNP